MLGAVDIGKKVILAQSEVLKLVAKRLNEDFDLAVSLIKDCSGMVAVTGLGKSGYIARKLASTFSSLGTPAFFIHSTEGIHGESGSIKEGSVLIALSNSGKTEEVLHIVNIVTKINVSVVSITNSKVSPLAKASTAVLAYGKIPEVDHLGLAPTSSTTAMLALGDALAVAVSIARGFNTDDFFRCHPGGQLGKLRQQRRSEFQQLNKAPGDSER